MLGMGPTLKKKRHFQTDFLNEIFIFCFLEEDCKTDTGIVTVSNCNRRELWEFLTWIVYTAIFVFSTTLFFQILEKY